MSTKGALLRLLEEGVNMKTIYQFIYIWVSSEGKLFLGVWGWGRYENWGGGSRLFYGESQ